MSKPVKILVRFTAIVLAIGAISYLIAPTSPQSSPYASALSDLVAGSAMAAKPPACENKVCKTNQNFKSTCVEQAGSNTNCVVRHGGALCGQSAC